MEDLLLDMYVNLASHKEMKGNRSGLNTKSIRQSTITERSIAYIGYYYVKKRHKYKTEPIGWRFWGFLYGINFQ
jgi:hypothetical protein